MLHKMVQSIPILLLLTAGTMAQDRREHGPSLQERSRQLEPLIIESAKRYGIDARILRMMCFIESRYRVDAVSPKGARGLMQFMPGTAARYGLRNPNDPKEAIDAAARYLRDLLARFGGRVNLALAAYNAGEGAVESFLTGRGLVLRTGKVINSRGLVTGGIPPYRETQAYVKAIVASLVATRPISLGPFALSPNQKPLRGIKSRDFTLEGTINDGPIAIKTKSTVNSSFIEVQ
jgi:soluble lytic murein transglycosylase-like protein